MRLRMKYKASALKIEASQIKQYIEKNKKVPKACTLSTGETISPYSIAYLFSLMVNDTLKNSTYDLINVRIYNTGKAHKDTINADVVKKDYMIMIDNFLKFCRKYHRVPRYITVPSLDIKVSFELYLYCISKIVVFIDKNKKLPNYCNFNKSFSSNTKKVTSTVKKEVKKSTSTSKKVAISKKIRFVSQPHYLTLGCNKLGQCTKFLCGPHTTRQALKKFGITKFSEKEIAKFAGSTSKGTSHQGINTAIAKISKLTGIKLSIKWVNFSDMGKTDDERFEAIGKLLEDPNTAIIWHIAYSGAGEEIDDDDFIGHYEYIDIINIKTKYVRALNSLGKIKKDGSYPGHLQDRKFSVQSYFAKHTTGGQPALGIIKKG